MPKENRISYGQQVFEGEGNSTSNDKGEDNWAVVGDKAMRYCMMVIGMFSGNPTHIQRRSVRYFTSGWHLLWCCLFIYKTIHSIVQLVQVKNEMNLAFTSQLVLLMLSAVIWELSTTVVTINLFVLCHLPGGLVKFYNHLATIGNESGSILSTQSKRTYRLVHCGIVVAGVLLTCALLGLVVLYIVDLQGSDAWTSEAVFTAVVDCVLRIQWAFQTTYIVSTSWTIWYLFYSLNSNFRKDSETSKTNLLAKVNHYRETHLSMCSLVGTVNRVLRFILSFILGGQMIVGLVFLHVLSSASRNELTADVVASGWYTFTLIAFSLVAIIFSADNVAESVKLYKKFNR